MEALIFPSAVATVRAILLAGLPAAGYPNATTPVVGKVPATRPARFVRILRIGGGRRDWVTDAPILTVEAWAGDDAASETLANACRAVINAAEGTVVNGVTIYEVTELSGPVNLPDPDSNQARHTWTVSPALRFTSTVTASA